MQLNLTTEYAIVCVAEIAKSRGVLTAQELSKRVKISKEFIPMILRNLKEKEIIKSVRGTNGGFTLGKMPEDISLYDIIVAIEKHTKISRCLEDGTKCEIKQEDMCKLKNYYSYIQSDVDMKLKTMTIKEIM